jgi:hypothetical protein
MVSYYQRPDWSYHAKGLWLTNALENQTLQLADDANIYAVTHGSGNFGFRSSVRDMESNLVLILPPRSPLIKEHIDEWNRLCDFAVTADEEGSQAMPLGVKLAFPLIRYFL